MRLDKVIKKGRRVTITVEERGGVGVIVFVCKEGFVECSGGELKEIKVYCQNMDEVKAAFMVFTKELLTFLSTFSI